MKLPKKFVLSWLDAFERSRIENHEMVMGFVTQLEKEGAEKFPRPAEAASRPVDYRMGHGWNASADGRQSIRHTLLAIWQERHYLKRAEKTFPKKAMWVVADDRRTGVIADWQRLQRLTRTYGGDRPPPRLRLDEAEGSGLVCFTPNLFALRPDAVREDFAHLSYLSLFAAPLAHPWGFLRSACRFISGIPWSRWAERNVWITTFLASSIDTLLGAFRPDRMLMLTSNSFVIELLRYAHAVSPDARKIVEVMHGIPTREVEAYHAAMYREFQECLANKLEFIASVPGLRLGNYPPGSVASEFAINLKINDARDRPEFARLTKECSDRARAGKGRWVIALNGAGTVEGKHYPQTGCFAMELAIFQHVRRVAHEQCLPVHLQYSIHPAHLKSGAAEDIAAALSDGVEVLQDSFQTWLEADLCISIFSSASWEAEALGCRVVIGIRPEDRIYSQDLLSKLSHPTEQESIFEVLTRELERLPLTDRMPPLVRLARAIPELEVS